MQHIYALNRSLPAIERHQVAHYLSGHGSRSIQCGKFDLLLFCSYVQDFFAQQPSEPNRKNQKLDTEPLGLRQHRKQHSKPVQTERVRGEPLGLRQHQKQRGNPARTDRVYSHFRRCRTVTNVVVLVRRKWQGDHDNQQATAGSSSLTDTEPNSTKTTSSTRPSRPAATIT